MVELCNPSQSGAIPQPLRAHGPLHDSKNRSCPRVVVCSDIRLLREGITLAVTQSGILEVVGAIEPEDAPALAAAQRPDVILIDAGVAGGRALPRLLKGVTPDLRVVVFALGDGEVDILGWAEAGVDGYVGRDGTVDDLTAAVEGAIRGEAFCSPKLVGLLFARVAQLSEEATPGAGVGVLTSREQQVMALVDQGLPNKEIARRLGIGHATVKNHVHHILEKMQAQGRGEAAARRRRAAKATPDPTSSTGRSPVPK
jgi:two-component system, NarL family, nitrate/nitrite response regulator NarL